MESFILQLMKSSVKSSPCPASSTLKTSTVGSPARLRILQTPSSLIVCRSPAVCGQWRLLHVDKQPTKAQ